VQNTAASRAGACETSRCLSKCSTRKGANDVEFFFSDMCVFSSHRGAFPLPLSLLERVALDWCCLAAVVHTSPRCYLFSSFIFVSLRWMALYSSPFVCLEFSLRLPADMYKKKVKKPA
jgi:hypothetical protein